MNNVHVEIQLYMLHMTTLDLGVKIGSACAFNHNVLCFMSVELAACVVFAVCMFVRMFVRIHIAIMHYCALSLCTCAQPWHSRNTCHRGPSLKHTDNCN